MTHYRRARAGGATWFFTVNLGDRRSNLLAERIDLIRDATAHVRACHPFRIDAMVVLPDHLHAVWSLPEDDADYALRWRLIKTYFSRRLPNVEHRSASRVSKGERGIWQRRYWEHLIRDDDDLQCHVDYIHFNPVKHGHVAKCADWAYSTFHRYVRRGWLPADWGVAADSPAARFGERSDLQDGLSVAIPIAHAGINEDGYRLRLNPSYAPRETDRSASRAVRLLRLH